MYQDDHVPALVEQKKSKHRHRRKGTFHYILQKKILKYLQHTVQTKTQFFCSVFGMKKMNGVETTIC